MNLLLTNGSPRSILKNLALRVQRIRIAQGITQEQLALKAGVSRRSLQNFEAGKSIALSSLINIAMALGRESDFEILFAVAEISPLALKKAKGKKRVRAFAPRKGKIITPQKGKLPAADKE